LPKRCCQSVGRCQQLDVSVELKTGLAAGLALRISIRKFLGLQTVLATLGRLFLTTSTRVADRCPVSRHGILLSLCSLQRIAAKPGMQIPPETDVVKAQHLTRALFFEFI
jgi:hypothetical protein